MQLHSTMFLAAALAAGLAVTPAFAEGENVGDTQMCIDSNRIKDTPVIDSKTILVVMDRGQGWKRIDLVNRCSGLHPGTGFAYGTTLNKLCKQDVLKVLEIGGQSCLIDQIVTIDEAEAKALRVKHKNKK